MGSAPAGWRTSTVPRQAACDRPPGSTLDGDKTLRCDGTFCGYVLSLSQPQSTVGPSSFVSAATVSLEGVPATDHHQVVSLDDGERLPAASGNQSGQPPSTTRIRRTNDHYIPQSRYTAV